MMIAYPDGTVVNALVLARDGATVRAIVPGDAHVSTFVQAHGVWISSGGQPVSIHFPQDRLAKVEIPVLSECICSPDRASRLMQVILTASERGELGDDVLFELSPEDDHVSVRSFQRTPIASN